MFVDYLDHGAVRAPGGLCLIRHDGSGGMTHAEFQALTHRFAASIQGRVPAGQGARVAVLAPNSPLALAAVIGVLRSGAAWIALNPRSEVDELAHLIRLVGCDLVISAESFQERSAALRERLGGTVSDWVSFADDGLDRGGADWLAPAGATAADVTFRTDAPAMIMGTGGTTGLPKAVPISHRQLLTMSMTFNAHVREPAPPVYLMATPMTHAASGVAFPVLAEGGTIVVHDGVVPRDIFDSIERHRVTRIFLPPTAIYALLAHPDVRGVDYSSLRHFLYAASPISVDKLSEAIDVFGPVMAQTYGQSEAPLICTYFGPDEHAAAISDEALRRRLASCGRASLGARVAVMDDDGGLLPSGARGEIVIRGDLRMAGYLNDPQASATVRRPGGWHATGDVGYIDGDGFVFIVDRKRDMIISGGFNVYPSEIEQLLWSHEAVLDCAVIGVPDERWGEAVTAVVELKPGYDVSEEDLILFCRPILGGVKTPKSIVFEVLPRSQAGKVLKRELRAQFWAGRDRQI